MLCCDTLWGCMGSMKGVMRTPVSVSPRFSHGWLR